MNSCVGLSLLQMTTNSTKVTFNQFVVRRTVVNTITTTTTTTTPPPPPTTTTTTTIGTTATTTTTNYNTYISVYTLGQLQKLRKIHRVNN